MRVSAKFSKELIVSSKEMLTVSVLEQITCSLAAMLAQSI